MSTGGAPDTPKFFTWALERARSSAEAIVPLVLAEVEPQSVVDFGCGVGVWLEAFARHGIEDYLGVDGPWVPQESLLIPPERFVAARLDRAVDLGRRFDLAVTLEVAEHLPERRAGDFVSTVVAHAPCVLFSAAVPHQGGTDHLNEQWPDYWAGHFASHGYVLVDAIRPLVWTRSEILPFYRQNVVLFASEDFLTAHQALTRAHEAPLSVVHPELLESVAAHPPDHLRRPSATDLRLGELFAALPTVAARSARTRLTRLTSRRRR
jgi:SAM-dependent methyltransferase